MRITHWCSARRAMAGVTALVIVCGTACHDLTSELPAGIADPGTYGTAKAAREEARYARYFFQLQLPSIVANAGLLTDEYDAEGYEGIDGGPTGPMAIDARRMGDADGGSVITLRLFGEMRRYTQQARQALAKYAPDDPPALRGEMYALEGITEVYMADVLCSGITLSTVDFEQDFTYTPQLTTQEVYAHAIALFDTAITLGRDSARVHFFARVGKARALVALGRYADADTVVADVPNGFRYQLPFSNSATWQSLFTIWGSVSPGEGGNGLRFRSGDPATQDPRVSLVQCESCPPFYSATLFYPTPRDWWTLASDVEARLIRAEAAIQRNDPEWLLLVNAIRTNGTYAVVEGSTDTLWSAGLGGVAGLAPLSDPGLAPLPPGKSAADVRVDLLFRERAFWLFLTESRQGDLRRLVRQYQRPQNTVYPSGSFFNGGSYGNDVNFPIEQDERYNPHFSQCFGRAA